MAQKSRAERVELLKEFPLKGSGKYRFNLEGRSEVKCPNWPECPSLTGVSSDGWRQVQIPFGRKLKDYTGRCSPCQCGSKKKTEPIPHSSGAVMLRAVRDPEDSNRVAYLCVDCCPTFERVEAWFAGQGVDIRAARDVTASALRTALEDLGAECDDLHHVRPVDIERREWSGRCDRCRDRARFNWVKLSGGGWARRDYEDPAKGWVICPACMGHRHMHIPSGKNLEAMSGRCPQCASFGSRTRTGERPHKSGALLLEDDRDSSRPRDKAAFLCANREQHPPDRPTKSYAWFSQFDDNEWHGLCDPCLGERATGKNGRRSTTDLPLHDDPRDPTGLGTVILYSQGDAREVPVKFRGCGQLHQPRLTRGAISSMLSAHKSGKRRFPPLCRTHFFDSDARLELAQSEAQTGNGQNNGSAAKRRRGAPKGSNAIITEAALQRAFNQLGSHATQEKVAEFLDVTDRAIRDWQKDKGLTWRMVQEQLSRTGSELHTI
jgi:hypothetical protein